MTITRRNGAQRLLDEAIRLWLDARDPLAVHMLAMAPFRVLYDLHRHENADRHARLKELLTDIGKERLYDLANKLKHADRDPYKDIYIPSDRENEWRIGFALVMYRDLEDDLTAEMGAFHLMYLSAYPDNFQVAADVDPDIEHAAQLAAQFLREDVEARRKMVRVNREAMAQGIISANVNLRRRCHDPDS